MPFFGRGAEVKSTPCSNIERCSAAIRKYNVHIEHFEVTFFIQRNFDVFRIDANIFRDNFNQLTVQRRHEVRTVENMPLTRDDDL